MSNPTFSPQPLPGVPSTFSAPSTGYIWQIGPPGDPTDVSIAPRVYASNNQSISLTGEILSRFVPVTFEQFKDVLYRVQAWSFNGVMRFESSDWGNPGAPGSSEYQEATYEWAVASLIIDEDHLLQDYPARESDGWPFTSSSPWRGYALQNPDAGYPFGSSGFDPEDSIGFTNSVDRVDAMGFPIDTQNGQLDLRFAEWAYADTAGFETTWGGAGGGFLALDFIVRGVPFVVGNPLASYPSAQPTNAVCKGSAATGDLVIIGTIGAASGTTPILGTIDGYDYQWILQPTSFWTYSGTYDSTTGL